MDRIFVISLRSGSYGNGYIISDSKTTLLFDAGIPRKLVWWAMDEYEIPAPDKLFISHEHSDHVKTLGIINRAFSPQIYATKGTLKALHYDIRDAKINTTEPFSETDSGSFGVRLIPKPHDAAEPVFFMIEHKSGHKIAIVTDIGHPAQKVLDEIETPDVLIVEANYEPKMLRDSNYPEYLKKRVAGDDGHLSNRQCIEFLQKLPHNKLKKVMLGHLSENNNQPEVAFNQIRPILPSYIELLVASRYEPVAVEIE